MKAWFRLFIAAFVTIFPLMFTWYFLRFLFHHPPYLIAVLAFPWVLGAIGTIISRTRKRLHPPNPYSNPNLSRTDKIKYAMEEFKS